MRAKSLVFDVYDMCYVEASLKANSLISFTLSKALVSLYYRHTNFVLCLLSDSSLPVWGRAILHSRSSFQLRGDINVNRKKEFFVSQIRVCTEVIRKLHGCNSLEFVAHLLVLYWHLSRYFAYIFAIYRRNVIVT